ncbi:putative RNA helicase [Orbilia oligospora]|uniref:Putative RNA helicase n=1 Tax=Orbilia oligospora TaxID=2813651 RepID=A0A7C8QS33_ORBOL|nr:putative RNA helicase [Orbilia oligospora]KAF3201036.1 putative RNA helicase [Orbilia oligospora]KAF3220605.1 putative RNA helicase [Orbilia oligospora]
MTTDFASLGVKPWLVTSLGAMAIKRPTPIQAACIPEILKGKNCIGGSRTGSGKTVAFAVPILQMWAQDPFGVFALILTPTRELALQLAEQFTALGSPQNLKLSLIIGGVDMRTQAISLSQKPHVVIATPGRLADHIRSSGADTIAGLRRVRVVVLDEADRLLDEGFAEELVECLSVVPDQFGDKTKGIPARQTLLFTATVTESVRALKEGEGRAREKGGREVFISEIDTDSLAVPPTLHQTYIFKPSTVHLAFLHTLLSTPGNIKKSTIIFTNKKATAQLLSHTLKPLGHRVTPLHSDLSQRERTDSLGRFRAGAARILIATDVAGRGLDIPEVELVINFDVPRDPDDYIHRIGRTARAGKKGESLTFVDEKDVLLIKAIEERVGREMVEYKEEEGVSLEGRVVREELKKVSEAKRVAMLNIEEGRDEKGRKKGGKRRLETGEEGRGKRVR